MTFDVKFSLKILGPKTGEFSSHSLDLEDKELLLQLEENSCRTQSELREALGVTRQAISKWQTQNFVKKKAEN